MIHYFIIKSLGLHGAIVIKEPIALHPSPLHSCAHGVSASGWPSHGHNMAAAATGTSFSYNHVSGRMCSFLLSISFIREENLCKTFLQQAAHYISQCYFFSWKLMVFIISVLKSLGTMILDLPLEPFA